MRFNDYYKQLCAALRFDDELSRRKRTFVIRCYTRGLSPNATLALLKLEPDVIEFKRLEAERAADRA